MTEKSILIQGKSIYYTVSGHGTPVVLLHGFAEDGDVWRYQQAALSKCCKLIIPDLPGSGKSAMIDDMSMEGLATCIKEIIEKEITREAMATSVIMIGHSMGGYITLAFAEKHPDLLLGFGLFHSTAFPDTEEKRANRRRGIAFIQTHGSYEFIKQSTPNLFTKSYVNKNSTIISEMIARYGSFDPLALVSYYEAMIQRPDRTAVLQSFNKPILFIIGKNDPAIPFEDSMKQCHIPQEAVIQLMQHSAHMGMWEEKDKSTDSLLSFLRHITV